MKRAAVILLATFSSFGSSAQSQTMVDMTADLGLGPGVIDETVARLCFADLNGDHYPDIIIDRHRVLLNQPAPDADHDSPIGRTFIEIPQEETGLLPPQRGTVTVFADLDNDGHLDALVTEYIDHLNPAWEDHTLRTGWHRGNGDGTFGERVPLPTPPRTTAAVAVGDVNRDGVLDIYLGNWYEHYGETYAGWPNDLLLSDGEGGWQHTTLISPEVEFDPAVDPGGRPTYGVLIAHDLLARDPDDGDDDDARFSPFLIDLNYGRRWNRLWSQDTTGAWLNVAEQVNLDGDEIRHGRYPDWLKERAKDDPRFDRPDEPPFRANGNTFDAAIADVNRDGRFDLFLAEITHGWAGESSDRSRFLLQQDNGTFTSPPQLNVDRIPENVNNWNHGDLFCELADINNDGRVDLILSSGDYPDNQRLRIYLQNDDGGFDDRTSQLGVDHDGSQQISLADVDGDGDLDLLVGQTFNRFTKEQREGRSPRPKLYINQCAEPGSSIVIYPHGDGETVNRDGLGAVATVELPDGSHQRHYLAGIGGHAGKQHGFHIHIGLGEHEHAAAIHLHQPAKIEATAVFRNVQPGRYLLASDHQLIPIGPTAGLDSD